MALSIAVIKEITPGENRVAATPDAVKKYLALGCSVIVESGAGARASFDDDAYKSAGATIGSDVRATIKDADVVLCVHRPEADTLERINKGATVIGLLGPYQFKDAIARFERIGGSAISLELVPRISRAQSMDVLSSQANLAGYRAVIEASTIFGRAFPMMMTAAGTVAPAKVFVMGAGVAGLQAIATARRLGAVVSATDVRAVAKEQVQSLGASFVMVENEETKAAETSGGYAKEMSEDYKRQQATLIADTIKKQDVVITTALIPGRPAPVLVTADMVKSMKAGSVIVDMATEMGGNCALSEKGAVVVKHGVTIVGYSNLPAHIAVDASNLYARNIVNVITLLLGKEKKALEFNFDDEIIKGFTLMHNGKAVHTLSGATPPAPVAVAAAAPAPAAPKTNGDAKPNFKRKPEAAEKTDKKEAK